MESSLSYKYDSQIEPLDNCPPESAQQQEKTGFRFVFADIGNEKNFLPVSMLNPKRQLAQSSKCSGYALSMFDSLVNARKKYNNLSKSHPNIGKTLGTHIARGTIASTDGLVTETNAQGHFDLYEFSNCDLSATFQIVDKF